MFFELVKVSIMNKLGHRYGLQHKGVEERVEDIKYTCFLVFGMTDLYVVSGLIVANASCGGARLNSVWGSNVICFYRNSKVLTSKLTLVGWIHEGRYFFANFLRFLFVVRCC